MIGVDGLISTELILLYLSMHSGKIVYIMKFRTFNRRTVSKGVSHAMPRWTLIGIILLTISTELI